MADPKDDAETRKQDPVEGARDTVERELKRQDDKAEKKPDPRPS